MGNIPEEHHKSKRVLKPYSELDVEIGARIRFLRKNIRMSLCDLGTAIGVTYQQMQKYEAGINRISVGSLIFIAEALNADPAILLAGLTPAGRDSEGDAKAKLAESSESQRLNRLFAQLSSAQDRALVVEFVAYLAARKRKPPPRPPAKSGVG